jgi:hypothetical protein
MSSTSNAFDGALGAGEAESENPDEADAGWLGRGLARIVWVAAAVLSGGDEVSDGVDSTGFAGGGLLAVPAVVEAERACGGPPASPFAAAEVRFGLAWDGEAP